MLELTQKLGEWAAQLPPKVLIGAGLVCVCVGLFIWLGGLGLKKVLAAAAGIVGGGVCGYLIAGSNVLGVIIAAAVGALVALLLEKAFMTLLAAGLGGAFAFLGLSHIYSLDLSTGVQQSWRGMPAGGLAGIAGVVAVAVILGFYLPRLVSALSCAVLGTVLVFAGMILLLSYKGSAPIASICNRPSFYGGVFVAMAIFGTCEQLLLCRRCGKKGGKKSEKEGSETKQRDWRTG